MELRWIFFDVGGTLLDETPVLKLQEDLLFQLLNERGFQVTEREWAGATRAARRLFLPNLATHLIWIFTEEPGAYRVLREEFARRMEKIPYEEYAALQRPFAGVREMLLELRGRYRLGIICNQPPVVRRRLSEEGLLDFFEVQAISSEMDLRKPDLRFFLSATAMVQAAPEECAMVGDRLDNDILPARALGMTTVRLKCGPHRTQPVISPEYLPHYTAKNVAELSRILNSKDFKAREDDSEVLW